VTAAKVLECADLYVGYDRSPVTRGLNLSVAEAEVLALLGPNGAGKTSTLLTVAGLLPALSGRVEVLGTRVRAGAPHKLFRRGLAFVPDDRALFTSLSVRDNLRVASRRREAVSEALEFFPSLQGRLKVAAGALSGGEQQMLALARAIITKPKLLLIDELSMGLAPTVVAELLPIVRRIATESRAAVVLVEQHVNQALAVADYAAVLVHGELRLTAPAADLLSDTAMLEDAYFGQAEHGQAEHGQAEHGQAEIGQAQNGSGPLR
jgi:branched-chain amino acid transport system ATP-binding protein